MRSATPILFLVKGIPSGARTVRGTPAGIKAWEKAVASATAGVQRVRGPCKVTLRFLLPPGNYSKARSYGPSLDDLAAPVLRALRKTVFSGVPSKDGPVLWLETMKLRVANPKEAGMDIIVEQLPKAVVTKKGADRYFAPRLK